MKNLILPLLAILALGACAGPVTQGPQGTRGEILQETQRQQEMVYQRYIEMQDRIFALSFPLRVANAEFCGRATEPMLGFSAWNIHTVGGKHRSAASALYNLKDRLAVQSLARQSPAARAGILSGDIIVAINGEPVPAGKNALRVASKLLDDAGMRQSQITLERNGNLIDAVVKPVQGCAYPVLLDYDSSAINAQADGKRIIISRGIVRFAENDNELALVIAHELAHNVMRHVDKLQQNALAGVIGGLAVDSLLAAAGVGTNGQFAQIGGQIGVQQHSVGFEQEADYIGMYFMERAGFNTAGVADFWRRMAAEGQSAITHRTTHPATPERFLAIERTHREIAAKKDSRQPLVPNLKR